MQIIRCLIVICLIAGQECQSQNVNTIDALLNAYNKSFLFDGSVLIAKGNQVLYKNGFGYANRVFAIPNTPKTKFRIASITKIFTATLVLQLAEEELISLNDSIGTYLKGLRPELGQRVQIKHLLHHTSGLDREYLKNDPNPNTEFSTLDLVKAVNDNTQFLFKPGDSLAYSNSAYVLLAGLIESVTQKSYQNVVEKRIFTPLGMKNSGYETSEKEIIPNLATGYRVRLGSYLNADFVGVSWIRGNGGVYSTVEDLFLFEQALEEGKLISKKSFKSMFEKSFNYSSFAMQWQVFSELEQFPNSSSGYAIARGASPTGFRTQWIKEIDGEYSIFILSNLDYCPRKEIAKKIFHILHGSKNVKLPQKPLALKIVETLRSEGIQKATELLRAQKETDEQVAALVTNELIELGFHNIQGQKANSSVALFIIADAVYPKNPGILVSLAYAYLRAGNIEKSKHFVDQVLRIAPNNKDAKEVLEELKYFNQGKQ